MKRIFRSRVPPALKPEQIHILANESHLTEQEIQEWYERFTHCYPRGYLSYKEFISYLREVNNQNGNDNQLTNSMVKQLYRVLDLNQDKQLNFEEFFLFNIVINQGSLEDKLRLILALYDREKDKYVTRSQLENILVNMFDLLNISKAKIGLSERLDAILIRTNFNTQDNQISWHTFITYIRNDKSLFALLIGKDTNRKKSDDVFVPIITRF